MANLIIKSSADNLVLQGSDASPAITVGATGTTTFAENATFSGTANNLGTISSATTFPAGHIIDYVGQNEGNCMGSLTLTTAVGDVLNSGVTITIGSGNKALILVSGWFYTEINHAGGDRYIALYKNVDGGGDVEMDEAWQGGESMKSYERMAISAMCYDNSVGSVVYKLKVKTVGTAGNIRYYTNMFAFELKG